MIPLVGTQLWADVRWRDGWRVQTHSELRVSRLLDPRDQLVMRGALEACEQALDRQCPSSGRADHLVVLLHGLGRTRHSMRRIDRSLREAGLQTARLDYPSMRETIEAHARTLARLLDHLAPPAKLSFVTHSLGGLIVRALLFHEGAWRSRMHRVVMLAPPNQGASLARTLDNPALRVVMGPSFAQIVERVPRRLPIPAVPVSIVAGRIGSTSGDGLVLVEETKLEGMAEHHVVPSVHTFVMNHPVAIDRSVSFLTAPKVGGPS